MAGGVAVIGAAWQVAVVQVPFLQTGYGTVSLSQAQWRVAITMASAGDVLS